jgi:uncharacterized Zn finger protein
VTAVLHPRIAARRGAARARTWWGKAWVRAVEEAAYAEAELRQARTLARSGRIGGITVDEGSYVAAVADGDEVWTVSGRLPVFDEQDRAALAETVSAESGRVAALLAGDLPIGLVEHAEEAGVELLPYGGELEVACTCPAWADPCQHALAVLYQLAWLIEADPLVLFQLRGLGRDDLLGRLHELTAVADDPTAEGPADDLDVGVDAALRAARVLELLDAPGDQPIDHLV